MLIVYKKYKSDRTSRFYVSKVLTHVLMGSESPYVEARCLGKVRGTEVASPVHNKPLALVNCRSTDKSLNLSVFMCACGN